MRIGDFVRLFRERFLIEVEAEATVPE